jgi:uncharacterized protein YxeA
MLTFSEVKKVIEAPVSPLIQWARDMNDKLLLHVEGVGLQDFLAKINNYENADQYKAREKHAISNKFITEELLRPTDNAFNARGGSKNYKFTTDKERRETEFVSILSAIKNSHSLSWYIENQWFNKFITDPNGLIVIDSDAKSVSAEKRQAYPTYKSIHSIKAYEQNGIYVDWVIFESHETVSSKKKPFNDTSRIDYYWAADEVNWYLIKRGSGAITIVDVIEHGYNRVPAILCSNIVDNVTGWKKSPIDAQVELLDKYVTSNSVINITEFFHNYPQAYIYVDECNRCNGTGNIGNNNDEGYKACPSCDNGKAEKKDPTDINKLKVPKEGEQRIDPPFGYANLPVDALKLQYTASDRTWNRIFFSHWGTVVSREGKNETATGRFIDAQPVNNRLNKYSKSIEQAHTALSDFLGQFYFPLTFEKSFIQYGRRYLIETPDQIWEKYLSAKKLSAPITTLDILIEQYLESEFRENETMLVVESKKVKLEPWVHWDVKTVRESETISKEDKQKKEFFGEWIKTVTIEDISKNTIEELTMELNKFIRTKTIGNEQE